VLLPGWEELQAGVVKSDRIRSLIEAGRNEIRVHSRCDSTIVVFLHWE
jgi:hypothetical protein